jgi:hypothetical protein
MSTSNFFIMVSCCALSVGSVLLTSSCGGGGGGGGGGTQVAPVELEGLVVESGGVTWTFKKGGQLDYTLDTGSGIGTLMDGFSVLWPDNLLGATYTYEVTGSRTAVVTIVAASGADWTSLISPGGGWIELTPDVLYTGMNYVGFYEEITPFELQMSLNFDAQQGQQIVAVTAHMRFRGVNHYTTLVQVENSIVDGILPDATLLKVNGDVPEAGYDPDKHLAGPQPSTKTDGLFDGDTIELYLDGDEDVYAKFNFTQEGIASGSTDLHAPVTEVGILQALWDVPSQADYSLVQIYGTDDVIVTITNDTEGNDGVITLHFQGNGDVGVYETSGGESGTFKFIEHL